ncbi:MAG: double zinc ribbon domain-containing protein, partial [Candidatus Puniceispirillaceae bacterium]
MRTKQILNFGLDLILPPSCVVCRARLSAHGLCGACWAELQPITDPFCSACGRPLPYAMRADLCGACHIR